MDNRDRTDDTEQTLDDPLGIAHAPVPRDANHHATNDRTRARSGARVRWVNQTRFTRTPGDVNEDARAHTMKWAPAARGKRQDDALMAGRKGPPYLDNFNSQRQSQGRRKIPWDWEVEVGVPEIRSSRR